MFLVTNPKVSGFVPEWAPFKGFSILFDNPGNHLIPLQENNKLKLLSCDMACEELELYQSLHQTLSLFPEMPNTYLFCRLPFHSYHVTLWDGINDANVHQLSRDYRWDAEDLLQDLTNSFHKDNEFFALSNGIGMSAPITFQFDQIIKWGNSVLVACLKPADSIAEIALRELEDQRRDLIISYQEKFGLETCSPSYSPHISLGYFANKEQAELAAPMIAYWNEQFLESTYGKSITFTSNSLYGFHNMATFIKK